MRVRAIIYADEKLMRDMDDKVYEDVGTVVAAAEHAGLARRVARLRPLICIKG
jgi:RNA-splicing ligase RtcB